MGSNISTAALSGGQRKGPFPRWRSGAYPVNPAAPLYVPSDERKLKRNLPYDRRARMTLETTLGMLENEGDAPYEPVPSRRGVNLALQGGGALGAFTWGVLDALLEDGRLSFEAISGTSAGAVNAVVLADGWVKGGRDGARAALRQFWRSVSRQGAPGSMLTERWLSGFGVPGAGATFGWKNPFLPPAALAFSPAAWGEVLSRTFSPYELNPLNVNPLKALLAERIDFAAVQACRDIRLHISATDVETGKIRVFTGPEITPDAVMASACLPTLFQAVEIDGHAYWDGGYMGNPALFPLFEGMASEDVLLVQINPVRRPGVPRRSREIMDRLNEITFNATLLREMRAIAFVKRLIREGKLDPQDYKDVRMHRIDGAEALAAYPAGTKLSSDWRTLKALHDIGREAATGWLAANFDALGDRPTLDLAGEFV